MFWIEFYLRDKLYDCNSLIKVVLFVVLSRRLFIDQSDLWQYSINTNVRKHLKFNIFKRIIHNNESTFIQDITAQTFHRRKFAHPSSNMLKVCTRTQQCCLIIVPAISGGTSSCRQTSFMADTFF